MVEYRKSATQADARLDLTFAALADPTRRAIMDALQSGERRVSDLATPFDMSLNAISKHVKRLEEAGLVTRRRAGREHLVSTDPAAIFEAARWFDEKRQFWNARLGALEKLIREETDDK